MASLLTVPRRTRLTSPDERRAPDGEVRRVGTAVVEDPQGASLRPVERAIARLVQPERVVAGNPTGLFALLWTTGGLWVLVSGLLGAFDGGTPALGFTVGFTAVVLGCALLAGRHVALPTAVNVAITLLGSASICLVVLAAGTADAAAGVGVLFVHVTCFSFVALPRRAPWLVAASAAAHLLVLHGTGQGDLTWVWLLTWGSAVVTGLVAGAVVHRLEDVAARLEAADDHKDEFLARISHELRAPLTAILGTVDTLLAHDARLDPGGRAQLHAVIRRHAVRQQRLVEDVLQLAVASTHGTTVRSADVVLVPLLREIAQAAVPDVDVQFDLPVLAEEVVVLADPHHVARIVTNLLVNAERYGGGDILVRVVTGGGRVRIDVVDHGPGIPGGFEGGALEPFAQAGAERDRPRGGVGLGLAIVRDLVVANDGRLAYATTHGGGATIQVLLPEGGCVDAASVSAGRLP